MSGEQLHPLSWYRRWYTQAVWYLFQDDPRALFRAFVVQAREREADAARVRAEEAARYAPLVAAVRHYAQDTVQPVAIDEGEPVYLIVQHDPAIARAALAALGEGER